MIADKIDEYIAGKDRDGFKHPVKKEAIDELMANAGGQLATNIRRQLMPREHKPRDGRLFPSEATKCARSLLYKFHDVPGEPLTGNAVMKFLVGDLIETSFTLLSGLTGRAIENNNLKIPVVIGGIERSGAIDGTTKKSTSGQNRLVEIKSMSAWSYKSFMEQGLSDDFGYMGQLAVYHRAALKLKLVTSKDSLYLAMNKDNQDIHEKLIPYHPEYAAAADANFKQVEAYAKKRKVMKRPVKIATFEYKGERNPVTGVLDPRGQLPVGCSYCPHKYTCWVDPVQIVKFDKHGDPLYSKKPTQHVERTFIKNWKGGMKPVFSLVETDSRKHELKHVNEAGSLSKW